jgi:YD repeat-containing protein
MTCSDGFDSELRSPVPATNFFLQKAWSNKKNMTTMKLLKILWFANGYWFAITNKKLFAETFEAWRYGPVLPSVYHEFKRFGAYPIEKGTYSCDFDPYKEDEANKNMLASDAQQLRKFLNKIWDMYGKFNANHLVNLTHQEGTPWRKVYNQDERFIEIPDDDIKEYFSSEFQKMKQYMQQS